MSALLFLALWGSAVLALRRVRSGSAERLLAAFLLVFVEILTIVRFAGAITALTPFAVTGGSLICIVLHAGFIGWEAQSESAPGPVATCSSGPPGWLWPAMIGLALIYAWRLILGRVLPPNWDALTYHLPKVWRWIEQRSFDQTGSGLSQVMNFPQNGERILAWVSLASGGALEPARVSQAFAVPLFGIAAFVLGERVAGRSWAWPVALAALSSPIVLIQTGEAYVDVFYSAFWLAALAGLAIQSMEPSALGWAIVAAGLGLAAGTKETLYFLLPILAVVVALIYRRPERRPRPGASAALLALMLWTGGGFYLHNWTMQGNPVWPYRLKLGPFLIFAGLDPHRVFNAFDVQRWFVPSTWRWLVYPFRETIKGYVEYSTENGFGALFAAGWALLPWAAIRACRARSAAALIVLAILVADVIFFLTIHPSRVPRYLMFLSVPVVVLLAYSMSQFTGRARAAALVLWSAGVLLNIALTAGSLLAEPGMSAAWRSLRRTGGYDVDAYLAARYGAFGQGWAALNHVLRDRDVVVANDTRMLLPWTGLPSRARVDVVVPRASDDAGFYSSSTPAGWLDVIDRLHARYLVLCRLRWENRDVEGEEAVISAHPETFQLFGRWQDGPFGEVTIYTVRRTAAP